MSLKVFSTRSASLLRRSCGATNLVRRISISQVTANQEKLQSIVTSISQLNLLEVAELNKLLKSTLNIPDAPVMAYGGAPAPKKEEEDEEVAAPVKVQTSFTLKLVKYDDTKKVALIKELKSLLEGMNLVQAKKFVESAPQVVKADIPKEEAEKLQAALTAAGAQCEIV
uniref:EOG090X0O3H n=1 Tax=Lynceus sp. MCZ IZ 141354 TaxID=1930659 RepID=A0A9N6ZG68_9CRUS|nr:EOG090X0O3H [Lynceus sp. MCZ IZ 141354]